MPRVRCTLCDHDVRGATSGPPYACHSMTDPSLPTASGVVDRLRHLTFSAWRSSLMRDAGKLGTAEVVRLLAGLLQAIVVARWLGPRTYGVTALTLAYPAFIFTVFDPQASEAVVKYFGEASARADHERARAVPKAAYLVDAVLAVFGLATVVVTAPWAVAHLLKFEADASLLVVAGVGVALAAPGDTSQSLLTTLGHFSTVAWVQAGAALARVGLVIGLVAADGGVAGVVWGTSAGLVAEGLLMGFAAHRALYRAAGGSWLGARWEVIRPNLREMTRFLIYTDLTSLVAVFVKHADVMILGYSRGPTETGWYRLALALTTPVSSVVTVLQTAAYPRFSRLVGVGDLNGVARTARSYFLKAALPLSALTLAGLPAVPTVIRLVAGDQYVPAAVPARWFLGGSAVVLAFFWVRPALFATGHVRYMFFNATIASAFTFLGFLTLVGPFGASGVAASRAVVAGVGGSTAAALRFRSLRGTQPPTSATTRSVIG